MRFVDKAVCHVRKIFPEIYASRTKKGSYHFSIAFSRNKMIAVGLNMPQRTDARALKIAQRLNLKDKIEYPYLHSEEHLIAKLIGMSKLDSSLNIVNLRLNKFGEFGMSRPCSNCISILECYGLNRIYWSDSEGNIITGL